MSHECFCARKEQWGAAMRVNQSLKEVAQSLTIVLLRHQMQPPMATSSTGPSATPPTGEGYLPSTAFPLHRVGEGMAPDRLRSEADT